MPACGDVVGVVGEHQVFDRRRPFDGKETAYHGNGAQVLCGAQVRQEVHQDLLCVAPDRASEIAAARVKDKGK
jgi:hypothetical protein